MELRSRRNTAVLRRVVLACVLVPVLALPVCAGAQSTGDDEAISRANGENQRKIATALTGAVLSPCGLTSKSAEYPSAWHGKDAEWHDLPGFPTEYVTFSVEGWTGGCVEGKRDGEGVLDFRADITGGVLGQSKGTTKRKYSGTFVAGIQQGLWCLLELRSFTDGKPSDSFPFGQGNCSIRSGANFSASYKKLTDGGWVESDILGKAVPLATTLPPGTLEQESKRVIGEARKGSKDVPLGQFKITSAALSDLVTGASLSMAVLSSPIDLKGKSVALLLSTKSIAALDRFASERLAFIETSSRVKVVADTRAEIIRDSEPQLLVKMIARALRARAGSVELVDDLSGLSKGDFDYALVADISLRVRFDLVDKFNEIPLTDVYQPDPGSIIVDESLGAFLISPEMQIVKTYNYHHVAAKTFDITESMVSPSRARLRDAGNISYFNELENVFSVWNPGSDAAYIALAWGL